MELQLVFNVCVALGIGLLIGAERERSNGVGVEQDAAGVRTFSVAALLGAVAQLIEQPFMVAVALLLVGGMALMSYWRTSRYDVGLTTEMALVLSCLLGALAIRHPLFAAGTGVALAGLLASKEAIHRFVRHVLTQRELHDLIMLGATALIVLPLAPNVGMGPFNAINPHKIAQFVLMVMSLSAGGYIARRLLGTAGGLAIAGLAGGFVSSTATLLSMGRLAVQQPAQASQAVMAGVLSNVATMVQLYLLVYVLLPGLLAEVWFPALAGTLAAMAYAVLMHRANGHDHQASDLEHGDRSVFDLKSTILLTMAITAMTLCALALEYCLGQGGVLAGAALSGFADAQAVVATLAALGQTASLSKDTMVWAILISFTTNAVSKAVVCVAAGSRQYASRVLPGLLLMVIVVWVAAWFN